MANYNYGTIRDGAGATDQSVRVVVFHAFDQLGPLTREVINNARIMWGPVDLLTGGVQQRKMTDEALAALVKGNDAKMHQKLEAEREACKGVWAPSEMERQLGAQKGRKALQQASRARGRRPTRASVAEAVERAMRRPVPRIADLERGRDCHG
jgi:hypothetical protein